jgi:hypothetical protein
MSRCNPAARWGPGTTCEKVADTAATREMEQRLAAMKREREAVDKIWVDSPSTQKSTTEPGDQKRTNENKGWITFRSSN